MWNNNSAKMEKSIINQKIHDECARICNLLIAKNEAYNNSLHVEPPLFPMDAETGIKARINDKLNRIKTTGLSSDTEDTLDDLIGYLIHLNIAYKLKNQKV
jgi:hypothetical protein